MVNEILIHLKMYDIPQLFIKNYVELILQLNKISKYVRDLNY